VNGGKGTGGGAGRVHLNPCGRGGVSLLSMSRAATPPWSTHASISERGKTMPSGRLQVVRITAQDSGG
jgi:hypothetical protein